MKTLIVRNKFLIRCATADAKNRVSTNQEQMK